MSSKIKYLLLGAIFLGTNLLGMNHRAEAAPAPVKTFHLYTNDGEWEFADGEKTYIVGYVRYNENSKRRRREPRSPRPPSPLRRSASAWAMRCTYFSITTGTTTWERTARSRTSRTPSTS